MKRVKKITIAGIIVLMILIIGSIMWFNFYQHFSPLYGPCTEELKQGMIYDEAKEIMNPFFYDSNISSDDSTYLSGRKRVLQFSDKNGVFCSIEFKENKIIEILFGREG